MVGWLIGCAEVPRKYGGIRSTYIHTYIVHMYNVLRSKNKMQVKRSSEVNDEMYVCVCVFCAFSEYTYTQV